jgi:selenide, water dikinase
MNLVAWPAGREAELVALLNGGADKVAEAGATMVGGHTIEDAEPKYGLAVTGLVDPRRMLSTVGARPGDRLVLTKPIGTGILTTAFKGGVLSAAELAPTVAGMTRLNRLASEVMQQVGVSACTDITGFGLLGHGAELAEASGVGLQIDLTALPLYPQVREMAACGLIPGGSYKNREFYLPRVVDGDQLAVEALDLLADPQTSGGLLIALSPEKVEALLAGLRAGGEEGWIIGEVVAAPAGRLLIRQD